MEEEEQQPQMEQQQMEAEEGEEGEGGSPPHPTPSGEAMRYSHIHRKHTPRGELGQ